MNKHKKVAAIFAFVAALAAIAATITCFIEGVNWGGVGLLCSSAGLFGLFWLIQAKKEKEESDKKDND